MPVEVTARMGRSMPESGTLLKVLLQGNRWQRYGTFCAEYDRAAGTVDPSLVGTYPSVAQYRRWLAGTLKKLPHPDHVRVIERMFPGQRGEALFQAGTPGDADAVTVDGTRALDGAGMPTDIVRDYSHRNQIPNAAWWQLFTDVRRNIDLLGYTLYFFPLEHPELVSLLKQKAATGCDVRLVIADPNSQHVANRDAEEDLGLTLGSRIYTSLKYFRPLASRVGIEMRFQDAPLYNSVFRFDDEMIMTPHLYGTPGAEAPALHLHRNHGNGLFTRFLDHFERIWSVSRVIPDEFLAGHPRGQ